MTPADFQAKAVSC